jgi:hypothetical protein
MELGDYLCSVGGIADIFKQRLLDVAQTDSNVPHTSGQ